MMKETANINPSSGPHNPELFVLKNIIKVSK